MNNLEMAIFFDKINNLRTKPKGKYNIADISVSYCYEMSLGKTHVLSERSIADIRYPNAPYSYRLRVENIVSANKKTLQYDGDGMLARVVFETLNAKERGR